MAFAVTAKFVISQSDLHKNQRKLTINLKELKLILKSSFKSRNYSQISEEHGPYFEVSAIQVSSVTLI